MDGGSMVHKLKIRAAEELESRGVAGAIDWILDHGLRGGGKTEHGGERDGVELRCHHQFNVKGLDYDLYLLEDKTAPCYDQSADESGSLLLYVDGSLVFKGQYQVWKTSLGTVIRGAWVPECIEVFELGDWCDKLPRFVSLQAQSQMHALNNILEKSNPSSTLRFNESVEFGDSNNRYFGAPIIYGLVFGAALLIYWFMS